jgi:hypothetical protein
LRDFGADPRGTSGTVDAGPSWRSPDDDKGARDSCVQNLTDMVDQARSRAAR